MALVNVNDSPKTTDTIEFLLQTTDTSGVAMNPHEVNSVTIYFLERDHANIGTVSEWDVTVDGTTNPTYFEGAVAVAIFGTPDTPAWLSSDTGDAFLTKEDFDSSGNPQIGVFSLQWTPTNTPSAVREGDYVLCYTWTPLPAASTITDSVTFHLIGDTSATTSIPTHFTPPDKYETLLDRYLPEVFKSLLGDTDITPDVLNRTNLSVAKGFTDLENLTNQIVDLTDANAVHEMLLPYLANLFRWKLKSMDVTLWRRQIKEAIPLYKRKGTLGGLTDALDAIGVTLTDLSQMWQIVSSTTWQEGFVVASDDLNSQFVEFTLEKLAILENPLDHNNFQVSLRLAGTTTYTQLALDYVSFANADGVTTVTWVGNYLSMNPIALHVGDVVVIVYKIAQPKDQALENYIRTLSLADQRDETTVTFPSKNWNVRLIADNDPFLDRICAFRNPFYDPIIYGKIRTEFPYSENIYNMEEYNGSTRDSTNPCDIDKNFMDVCSCCISSSFTVNVEVTNLTQDRIEEVQDIITNFVPFHAIVHQINYTGSFNDFVLSPVEEIETIINFGLEDSVMTSQFDFNRLILEGDSDANTLKRNMLATANVIATPTGTGINTSIVLFSPGIQFDTLGIDNTSNKLEILSGLNTGVYPLNVVSGDVWVADLIQGHPSTVFSPLDKSSFPFRISNIVYNQPSASIYQDNQNVFSDASIVFPNVGTQVGWTIVVSSGLYVGTYSITSVNTDDSVFISGWTGPVFVTGINYTLRDLGGNVIVSSSIGQVLVNRIGRVEIGLVTTEFRIRQGYYVDYNGVQYPITNIVNRGLVPTVDKVYISGYTGGNVVGAANVTILNRLVNNAVGYLDYRGMQLTGAVPTVNYTLENNQFLESYLILIGTNYYQIASINGSTMILNGPMLDWGLSGTSVSYSIIQFIKTSPITTETGVEFGLLDRRGNDSFEITQTTSSTPMPLMMNLLNNINNGGEGKMDFVSSQESIIVDIRYR